MFASVAHRYDLVNSLLSFGRHSAWRRKAADLADLALGGKALDVCCGTGDLARELARRVGAQGTVWGLDFCRPMLTLALAKAPDRAAAKPNYVAGDSHQVPFASGTFDCASIAFGIRNVADPRAVFAEMARVVRPGGRVVCLEFAVPDDPLRRGLVRLYERTLVPLVGGALAPRNAYAYLANSIQAFARPPEIREMMELAGLAAVRTVSMHLGSVCAHVGARRR